MTREERAEKKRIVQSLGEAFAALPEAKREFLIGYAAGGGDESFGSPQKAC